MKKRWGGWSRGEMREMNKRWRGMRVGMQRCSGGVQSAMACGEHAEKRGGGGAEGGIGN